jgi:hypothetical protein
MWPLAVRLGCVYIFALLIIKRNLIKPNSNHCAVEIRSFSHQITILSVQDSDQKKLIIQDCTFWSKKASQ